MYYLERFTKNIKKFTRIITQHGDMAPYREGSADDAYLLVSHTFIFTVIWLL